MTTLPPFCPAAIALGVASALFLFALAIARAAADLRPVAEDDGEYDSDNHEGTK